MRLQDMELIKGLDLGLDARGQQFLCATALDPTAAASADDLADLRPAVETSTLALGRGLLLVSDAVWFISAGVVEEDVEGRPLIPVPLGASCLSGAIGMTTASDARPSAELPGLTLIVRDMAGARRNQGQSAKLA
jgi:hypothetical protein